MNNYSFGSFGSSESSLFSSGSATFISSSIKVLDYLINCAFTTSKCAFLRAAGSWGRVSMPAFPDVIGSA